LNKYLLLALCLLFIGCEKKEQRKIENIKVKTSEITLNKKDINTELAQINDITYIEKYIEKIINNGSNQNFGFPTKTMDAGIAHAMDAKDIARYVITLGNRKSTNDQKAKKAEIFYSSNCGGCHGNDGKGLNGTFPDLTIDKFLGIKKREEFLISQLKD